MARQPKGIDTHGIVPSEDEALLGQACPDLNDWPRRWQCEAADLFPGTAIVTIFKPFLLELLRGNLSQRTFNRHRDNLWLVGGEMIRRRYDDSDLKRLPADQLVRHLIEEDGGPLIWPRVSEAEQTAVDATCRKFYQFLDHSTSAERPQSTHRFR
jgi:hypothetical protein